VNLRITLAVFIMSFVAGGCASTIPQQPGGPHPRTTLIPPAEPQPSAGQKVVSIAAGLLGTPYRFGGDTPKGFDCSGLVFYSFEKLGVKVPRTAADQREAAERVKRDDLEPGDLVFFRGRKGRQIDHVGIYAGEGRFIHAPNAGKVVSYGYLDDPYYRKHFASAGRF
jgi:cell wall-associated NlpC family hydrolase